MSQLNPNRVEELLEQFGVKVYSIKEYKFLGIVYKKRHFYYCNGIKQFAKTKEELKGYTPGMLAMLNDKLCTEISKKNWLQISMHPNDDGKVAITLIKNDEIVFSHFSSDVTSTLNNLYLIYGKR